MKSSQLYLVPTASATLRWAIKDSPSWAWLFRSQQGDGFDEVLRLYQATNALSGLYCRQPAGYGGVTIEYFGFYGLAASTPSWSNFEPDATRPLKSAPPVTRNPLIYLRNDLLCLFLDLMPINSRRSHLGSTFTKAQFRAVAVFLPDDILSMINYATDSVDSVAIPWRQYMEKGISSDKIK